MKARTLKKNKINVITLGCSKNIYDSEVLMGRLKASRMDVVHEDNGDDASIIIINTCGFIENAKQESIDTILHYADAKKKGLIRKLYVTGCLSERYKPELEKEIPEVNAYFGTNDLPRLLKTLKADYKNELVGERLLTTPSHYAYFKIAEGCDRPCSFCAIPLMRGRNRSVPMENLIREAVTLAKKGTTELILIAQDLTSYGLDIYKKRKLAELLENLSAIENIKWIRLHYAFPAGFPMDVLDVIRDKQNICNYLDMPLQHISDELLKSMRRGITRRKTIDLITTIRDRIPGIALRTTLISGYPGETEKHHEEMLEWVRQTRFDRLGIFPYSHEENTFAFSLPDNVPAEIKQQRAEAVMKVQQEISAELNRQKEGKVFNVMVDRKEGEFFVARTEFDSPEVDNEVLLTPAHTIRVGEFVRVKIKSSDSYDLYGEVIS